MNNEYHVVLGAGPLGLDIVRRLVRQGRRTRLITRSSRPDEPGIEVTQLDASNANHLQRACKDASVLYFCAGSHADRTELYVPLVQGVTEGVARAGCRMVYADNMAAYGPVEGPVREGLPHRPTGVTARARAAAVDHVLVAHRLGRIAADVICSTDFFGPGVTDSILGKRVFEPAVKGGVILFPGEPDVAHSYTYIRDFGRAMVAIGGEAGSFGEIWHIPPSTTRTNRAVIEAIVEMAGQNATCQFIPGWAEKLSGFFNRTSREQQETAYLRRKPWIVQAERLRQRFGFEATPIDEAIGATLDWYRARSTARIDRSAARV